MNNIDNEMLILIEKNENVVNRKCFTRETTYFSVSGPPGPTTRTISIIKKK